MAGSHIHPVTMSLPALPWKPTLALKLSTLTVFIALATAAWRPDLWAWALAALCINRAILVVAGLIPRSTLLGANITRLPQTAARRGEVAITIDDGPNPDVTPHVLDILDEYQAKATFFCIGELAMRYPELCREIVKRGHLIENHTHTHNRLFSLFLPYQMRRDIESSQRALTEICGRTPRFFRPTAGLRNPELGPLLALQGLMLCNWSKRGFDTLRHDPAQVLARLTRDLKAGDILLLHDGSAGRCADGTPLILKVLPSLLDTLKRARLHPVTLDAALPPAAHNVTLSASCATLPAADPPATNRRCANESNAT